MKKEINKFGQEVKAYDKAKLHIEGSFCIVGDTVYPTVKFNTSDAPELGTPLTVKLIYKSDSVTVLEFEETTFSAASSYFKL
ncbi:hypothetical protein D3C71_1116450 [compost metagenome]